jgi:hypothetical protein
MRYHGELFFFYTLFSVTLMAMDHAALDFLEDNAIYLAHRWPD